MFTTNSSKLFSHFARGINRIFLQDSEHERIMYVVWIYYFHPQICIMQSWSKNEKQQIIFHLIFTIHSLDNKWNLESVPSVPIDLLSGKIPIQWFQKLPCMLKIKKNIHWINIFEWCFIHERLQIRNCKKYLHTVQSLLPWHRM